MSGKARDKSLLEAVMEIGKRPVSRRSWREVERRDAQSDNDRQVRVRVFAEQDFRAEVAEEGGQKACEGDRSPYEGQAFNK